MKKNLTFEELANILVEQEGAKNTYVKSATVEIFPLPIDVKIHITYKATEHGPVQETKYDLSTLTHHAMVQNSNPIGYIDEQGNVYSLDVENKENLKDLYNEYPVDIDFLKANYEFDDNFDITKINKDKKSVISRKKQNPVMLFPVRNELIQQLIKKDKNISYDDKSGIYKLKTSWGDMDFSNNDYLCLYSVDNRFKFEYAVGEEDMKRTYKPIA